MNETSIRTNGSDNANIERELNQINEQLSSISAKEVLFIITLSFLALFAAVNMCLLILERRNKKKQNSVPQAIVIQPNSGAKSENSKKLTTKTAKVATTSSNYERDVLPSKSMKMKVSISPSMSAAKKPSTKAPSSKESVVEEQSRPSEVDKKPKVTPAAPVAEVQPVSNPSSAPSNPANPPSNPPNSHENMGSESSSISVAAPLPPLNNEKAVEKPAEKPVEKLVEKPEKSEKSDSNTSFTVPDGAMSPKPPTQKDAKEVSTPTETTLSGSGTASKANSITSTISFPVAKDASQAKSPSMPPVEPLVRTPDVSAPPIRGSIFGPGPVIPPASQPPASEKKI